MDFKKFITENHPDPDFVFGMDSYDFEQIVVLAENFAKKKAESESYYHKQDINQLELERKAYYAGWVHGDLDTGGNFEKWKEAQNKKENIKK